jgi:hypothetical protein
MYIETQHQDEMVSICASLARENIRFTAIWKLGVWIIELKDN